MSMFIQKMVALIVALGVMGIAHGAGTAGEIEAALHDYERAMDATMHAVHKLDAEVKENRQTEAVQEAMEQVKAAAVGLRKAESNPYLPETARNSARGGLQEVQRAIVAASTSLALRPSASVSASSISASPSSNSTAEPGDTIRITSHSQRFPSGMSPVMQDLTRFSVYLQ